MLFGAGDYDKLKGFFDNVSNKDRAQAVLRVATAANSGQ
jgi:hypothetical protein